MALRDCWNCEARAHQTMHGDPHRRETYPSGGAVWMAAFRCDECQALSIAAMTFPKDPQAYSTAKGSMDARDAALDWLPVVALGRRYPDVPDHIAEAASEAHACHSIRMYRAAVLMARSVIEATAKDKKVTDGKLQQKIDKMHQQGFINELVRDMAHEIRHLGNDMAHGDFVDPVSEEESAETLELMSEVLGEVYQTPAKLRARRDARLAKQQAKPATP